MLDRAFIERREDGISWTFRFSRYLRSRKRIRVFRVYFDDARLATSLVTMSYPNQDLSGEGDDVYTGQRDRMSLPKHGFASAFGRRF